MRMAILTILGGRFNVIMLRAETGFANLAAEIMKQVHDFMFDLHVATCQDLRPLPHHNGRRALVDVAHCGEIAYVQMKL